MKVIWRKLRDSDFQRQQRDVLQLSCSPKHRTAISFVEGLIEHYSYASADWFIMRLFETEMKQGLAHVNSNVWVQTTLFTVTITSMSYTLA